MESVYSWLGASPTESLEPLYRPATDPAANLDDWFGVMNYSPADCLPRNVPKKTLGNTYLVMLSDLSAATYIRKAILELIDDAVVYKTLPLIEIVCGEEIAKRVESIVGVEFVLPALEGFDKTRSIAIGIDLLASFEREQRIGLPSNYLFGGRTAGEAPGYPVMRYEADRSIIDADPGIEWPAEPAIMPVINISLGTKPTDYPVLRNDIVNLATYGAASINSQLIVFSAGNCGYNETGPETMSAWAQAPWVLSVGATVDADGQILAEYSARGVPDDPESGPDVVAWGQSAIPPYPQGTSFAAPYVSFYAMVCAAALLEMRHGFQVATGQTVEGVRLVGCGFIDSWGQAITQDTNPRIPVPVLPVIGLDMNGITNVARLAADHGINISVQGNAKILRSLLLKAAKKIPRYERYEIGAGFLNEQIVLDCLATLSGADVLAMFATQEVVHGVSAEASRWHMFDRSQLNILARIVGATAPQWRYDWRRPRLGGRPYVGEDVSMVSQGEREDGIAVNWPPAPLERQRQEEN